MKKLVTLISVVVMALMTVVAPVSAATAGYSGGCQVEFVNSCIVSYDIGTKHTPAAENYNGRILSYRVWAPITFEETQAQAITIKVLDQDVTINPTCYDDQNPWVNPTINLCGTKGIRFISSEYEPVYCLGDLGLRGGYITVDFINE